MTLTPPQLGGRFLGASTPCFLYTCSSGHAACSVFLLLRLIGLSRCHLNVAVALERARWRLGQRLGGLNNGGEGGGGVLGRTPPDARSTEATPTAHAPLS